MDEYWKHQETCIGSITGLIYVRVYGVKSEGGGESCTAGTDDAAGQELDSRTAVWR